MTIAVLQEGLREMRHQLNYIIHVLEASADSRDALRVSMDHAIGKLERVFRG